MTTLDRTRFDIAVETAEANLRTLKKDSLVYCWNENYRDDVRELLSLLQAALSERDTATYLNAELIVENQRLALENAELRHSLREVTNELAEYVDEF